MEHIGSHHSVLICLLFAGTIGLGLLFLQPVKSELQWQAKVEQRLTCIITIIIIILSVVFLSLFSSYKNI
jgi:hypothetical protein